MGFLGCKAHRPQEKYRSCPAMFVHSFIFLLNLALSLSLSLCKYILYNLLDCNGRQALNLGDYIAKGAVIVAHMVSVVHL